MTDVLRLFSNVLQALSRGWSAGSARAEHLKYSRTALKGWKRFQDRFLMMITPRNGVCIELVIDEYAQF